MMSVLSILCEALGLKLAGEVWSRTASRIRARHRSSLLVFSKSSLQAVKNEKPGCEPRRAFEMTSTRFAPGKPAGAEVGRKVANQPIGEMEVTAMSLGSIS